MATDSSGHNQKRQMSIPLWIDEMSMEESCREPILGRGAALSRGKAVPVHRFPHCPAEDGVFNGTLPTSSRQKAALYCSLANSIFHLSYSLFFPQKSLIFCLNMNHRWARSGSVHLQKSIQETETILSRYLACPSCLCVYKWPCTSTAFSPFLKLAHWNKRNLVFLSSQFSKKKAQL